MTEFRERNWVMIGLGLGSPLLLGMISCESDGAAGLTLPAAGMTGGAGRHGASGGSSGAENTQAGAGDAAGAAGQNGLPTGTGGTHAATGGSGGKASGGKGGSSTSHGGSGQSQAGAPGSGDSGGAGNAAGESGMAEGGMGGETQGNGGAGDETGAAGGGPDVTPVSACIFHSAPVPPVADADGGAPAPNGVNLGTNTFLGPYLTDLAGITLYIYGADVPGDCNTPPVSNCIDDCTQSWPIFDAGERTLAATLDDAVFGTIQRGDGTFQTTYYGWPLYRYKSDTTSNTINGQGKGKTWFTAEVALPNLMIMRGPVSDGGIKYLSDDRGRTLYTVSGDVLGTSDTDPVSACTGTCLDTFSPFAPGAVYPVTSLEPHDVTLFFRADGALQTAYKGAPLYLSKLDAHAGEHNALTLLGGALVLP